MSTSNKTGFNFKNSYSQLSKTFFSEALPDNAASPKTVLFNRTLAEALGLNIEAFTDDITADWFSGNTLLEGSNPLAQAYAGHQFGNFTMLGDGRAILLGEHISPQNFRFDIQLKGAGQTAYSRRGDGRATLRAMLREYLISEAMHGLGIPTSRSLAVVSTGEKVWRDQLNDGAILTRIMLSHIRVGTFEYVRNFLTIDELETFTNYVIERHYPDIKTSENPPLELLKRIMDKQIDLIVNWMRVGFIHGVMNTDNMSIAGETFDYGPCAFMNDYNPKTVFSSIDTNGRYAYGNQPRIAHWNLSCLASALLPLIHKETSEAIKLVEKELQTFPEKFKKTWGLMMVNKLGFSEISEDQSELDLVNELLNWMEQNKADYTNTFLYLQNDLSSSSNIYRQENFITIKLKWENLLSKNKITSAVAIKLMKANNPVVIPRNHLVEEALDNACHKNDYTLFQHLLQAISAPYQIIDEYKLFQHPPEKVDLNYRTYCGT